jgi:perosamine synthetase
LVQGSFEAFPEMQLPWRSLPPVLTRVSLSALLHQIHPFAEHDPFRTLEKEIRVLLGAGSLIATDSGTSALRLAIERSGKPGDVVAMPAFACFDLITAARGANRRVILYDLDARTLTPSMTSLQDAIQVGAATIVAAPLYGYPWPMQQIAALVEKAGVILIEDIAQAVGAATNNAMAGSWGSHVVMSFGRGKGIGGAGGGLLFSRVGDDEYTPGTHELNMRGTVGLAALTAFQQIMSLPALFAIPSAIPAFKLGETIYHEPWIPQPIKRLQAGLAANSLNKLDEVLSGRLAIAARLRAVLLDSGVTSIEVSGNARPSWLRMGAFLNDHQLHGLFRSGARRSYPLPLNQHPAMRSLLISTSDFEGASLLSRSLATLPTHHRIVEPDFVQMRRSLSAQRIAS